MSRATKPNIPRSVLIGGVRVKIRIVPNMEDWGSYDHDEKLIELSSRCLDKAQDLRSTLRHEIMHAALSIGGCSYMTRFEEESVIRCFDELFFPCWDKLRDKYDI